MSEQRGYLRAGSPGVQNSGVQCVGARDRAGKPRPYGVQDRDKITGV